MGYSHIGIEERCEIARLLKAGTTIRQIAASLDRSPSAISREVNRNRLTSGEYKPVPANERAQARRWRGPRLDRDDLLREAVLWRLAWGASPDQVAGRLALEMGRPVISDETIYRFIYGQVKRKKDYGWRHYLPQAKAKRGRRSRKGRSSAVFIRERRPLAERPPEAADRVEFGHWEADTMLFGVRKQALLILHERASRLSLVLRPESKGAEPVAQAMVATLGALPLEMRRSVTFDNGTEFARHYELHAIGTETFFCDVRSPWQKGGVENAIGRLRRELPRKTDLDGVSDEELTLCALRSNNTPRAVLGYRTPVEVFWSEQQVLRFECGSTFPLSRE